MPRDTQGSYSLPTGTLVNAGDTIEPSQHNPAMSDIAQALSGSLSRDGLGGMRAALPMGGNRITNIGDGTLATDGASVGQVQMAAPIGAVIDYAGAISPQGWLFCGGQAVSRTTYAALFAIIGTIYGAGDGSTTFNLPDLRGRVVAGKDDMGGSNANRINNIPSATLGGAGGLKDHELVIGEIPAHSHGVTDPGHTHGYSQVSGPGGIASGVGFGQFNVQSDSAVTGISINNAGGGGAHNNVQPTLILNKIIKAA